MTQTSSAAPADAQCGARTPHPRDDPIHPLYVRLTHWINALAILIMIGSGWQIYNASPLFAIHLSQRRDARRLAGRRPAVAFRGHVAADRQRSRLRDAGPRRPAASGASCCPSGRPRSCAISVPRCAGRLSHDDLARYNAVQKLLYAGVLLAGVVVVASGLRPLEARAAARSWPPCSAATRARDSCISSPWSPSSCSSSCMSSWRCSCPKSLRAMIRGR